MKSNYAIVLNFILRKIFLKCLYKEKYEIREETLVAMQARDKCGKEKGGGSKDRKSYN